MLIRVQQLACGNDNFITANYMDYKHRYLVFHIPEFFMITFYYDYDMIESRCQITRQTYIYTSVRIHGSPTFPSYCTCTIYSERASERQCEKRYCTPYSVTHEQQQADLISTFSPQKHFPIQYIETSTFPLPLTHLVNLK